MPPDKNQNINLLPSDLERQRRIIKQVIAQAPKEYTKPANGHKDPKKTSFWSKLFSAKPKTAATAVKADHLILKPKLKPLVVDETLLPPPSAPPRPPHPAARAPKPDFLADDNFKPKAEPKAEVKPAPKKIEMTEAANGGQGNNSDGEDFGVNLLSAEYASAFIKQNQKSFFLYSAGAAASLVIIVYLGLHLYQIQKAGQVAKSQQASEELTAAINSFKNLEKEDQQLAKKVAAVKDLLAAHISTRAFLEKLESVIIPEVTFKALAATQNGGVTVSASATSYTALARQLTILQENVPWIKEVTMASAGAVTGNQGEDEGVEFDMVLRVDPVIFKANQAK